MIRILEMNDQIVIAVWLAIICIAFGAFLAFAIITGVLVTMNAFFNSDEMPPLFYEHHHHNYGNGAAIKDAARRSGREVDVGNPPRGGSGVPPKPATIPPDRSRN